MAVKVVKTNEGKLSQLENNSYKITREQTGNCYCISLLLYDNVRGLPPCQALSLSVGENRSIRAPTTSSANCFGNRPVILPILLQQQC